MHTPAQWVHFKMFKDAREFVATISGVFINSWPSGAARHVLYFRDPPAKHETSLADAAALAAAFGGDTATWLNRSVIVRLVQTPDEFLARERDPSAPPQIFGARELQNGFFTVAPVTAAPGGAAVTP